MAEIVIVSIVLNPMGDFKAKTKDIKGEATQKGNEVSAQNIIVNLANLKTGIELRDKHTQKHLDVKKFPEAILISATGKDGIGKGRIKIRGIEKDIGGEYKIEGKVLKANFKLKLSDFGIGDINYMGVGVEDEVSLSVDIPIKS
jgi:polyisoprenoid-binding protein YceI